MAGAQLLQIWLLTALEWEVELVAPSVGIRINSDAFMDHFNRFHDSIRSGMTFHRWFEIEAFVQRAMVAEVKLAVRAMMPGNVE